jgi:hypothetical protein
VLAVVEVCTTGLSLRTVSGWLAQSAARPVVLRLSDDSGRADPVSYLDHRLTTEAERARFFKARWAARLCAMCGRDIGEHETIYVETIALGRVPRQGPVGIECASEEFLQQTWGQEPDCCAGCGREVFYRTADRRRRRALCSKRCGTRASTVRRRQVEA